MVENDEKIRNKEYTASIESGPFADAFNRVNKLASLLDTRYIIPGTDYRCGLDAILGLIPGVGDAASSILSLYIVYEAYRVGVRKRVILQMAWNVLLDFLIGLIPIIGDYFDMTYKANIRNVLLLKTELERIISAGVQRKSEK